MHMINIRRAFAGIGAGLLTLLLTNTPSAQATTPATTPMATTATICDTGYRGQPAYDQHCLTTGTPADASDLWRSVEEGRKGHERDDYMTQRGICKYANRHGGIMNAARELVGDMSYDNYKNNEQVNRWTGQDATLTCAQLGYRI